MSLCPKKWSIPLKCRHSN